MNVHPTAIIDPQAKIHPSCKIGPYCVIGPQVQLGEGCHLVSHVVMEGPSKIGADNGFFPFSSIGLAPQDMTYAGERTQQGTDADVNLRRTRQLARIHREQRPREQRSEREPKHAA